MTYICEFCKMFCFNSHLKSNYNNCGTCMNARLLMLSLCCEIQFLHMKLIFNLFCYLLKY